MGDVSPLAEVERIVQARAKLERIDMAVAAGHASLVNLIRQEVAGWQEEHRRGDRPFDLAEPERIVDRAFRNLAGYGPLEPLLG